jgi:L-seryl-tRNA(Ser) seleniumtransferase
MLATPLDELQQRANQLARRLGAISGVVVARAAEDEMFVGGGSLPDQPMKTRVVEITARDLSDADLACRLRTGSPSVLGRVRDRRLVFDLRTVFAGQEDELVKAVEGAVSGAP